MLAPGLPEDRLRLLCRVLACRDVDGVDLNTAIGEVVLRLSDPATTGRSIQATLAELSAGIRGDRASLSPESLPKDCLRRGVVSISRYAGQLSTWHIGLDAPGRMRLRHPELRRDRALARSVERVLVAMPGVRQARMGRWRSEVMVLHDPEVLEAAPLISILQHMVDTRSTMPAVSSTKGMLASSATLGLAAATDFVLPGLAPLTSLVLVGKNVGTISRAAGDTLRRRVGMPTVMTAILLGTLATGSFMASGIMAWSYDFWKRRHRRDVESERRLLLEDVAPLPECSALLDAHGQIHVRPVEASHRGSLLQVHAEQMVPLDGEVVEGQPSSMRVSQPDGQGLPWCVRDRRCLRARSYSRVASRSKPNVTLMTAVSRVSHEPSARPHNCSPADKLPPLAPKSMPRALPGRRLPQPPLA